MGDDKKQDLTFEAGEVIVCTTGEYSNYGIEFFAVATKPFDLAEQAQSTQPRKGWPAIPGTLTSRDLLLFSSPTSL